MYDMENVLEHIKKSSIIAIMRGVQADKVTEVAKALYEGGVMCIEVTFNQKGDPMDTVKAIEAIEALKLDGLCVGAGTVMSTEQVRLAYKAGAKYIISPDTNPEVIRLTKELGLVSMPGALTPTEIATAYNLGADIVKLFPAGNFGTAYIKAIKAPISHIPMAAVGGVSLDNIQDFKKAGIDCFGIGSYIVDKKLVEANDYKAIAANAKAFMDAVK